MNILITQEQFKNLKSRSDVPLECIRCKKIFNQKKHHVQILMNYPPAKASGFPLQPTAHYC